MATTDDPDPPEDTPDWEAIARRQLAREAEDRSRDLDVYVSQLGDELTSGDADAETIREFRRRVDALLNTVERKIASVVDGIDPYDSAAYVKDTRQALNLLDLTAGQATEASDGATVQLGTNDLRRLCNGQPVPVQTKAGIDIEVQPKTLGDSEAGP